MGIPKSKLMPVGKKFVGTSKGEFFMPKSGDVWIARFMSCLARDGDRMKTDQREVACAPSKQARPTAGESEHVPTGIYLLNCNYAGKSLET